MFKALPDGNAGRARTISFVDDSTTQYVTYGCFGCGALTPHRCEDTPVTRVRPSHVYRLIAERVDAVRPRSDPSHP